MRDFVGRVPDLVRLTDRALSYSTTKIGTEVGAVFPRLLVKMQMAIRAPAAVESSGDIAFDRPSTAAFGPEI